MRVTKSQIINGITDYIENEVVPKMSDDKSMQIIVSLGINMIKANSKVVDAVFSHPVVTTLLEADDGGMYEIEKLFEMLESSVSKFGYFPIVINPIPIISPTEKELKFTADDIAEIKKRIERSN